MKKLLILGIVTFLTACSVQNRPSNYKYLQIQSSVGKEAFDKGYKGAIILETSHNINTGNVIPNNIFVFKDENDERIELDFLGSTGILYLSPGHYKLVSGRMYGYRSAGNYTFTISQNYNNLQAEFDVKPGEISYLGDLNLTVTKVNTDKKYSWLGSSTSKTIEYDVKVRDHFEIYNNLYKLSNTQLTKRLIKATNK